MKSLTSSQGFAANAQAATEFLRADGKMAAVLPTAARLVALQKYCTANLPHAFRTCTVLKLEEGALTLSAPNAAAAARLKQNLPGLQEKLNEAGWRIESIRVKVQMNAPAAEAPVQEKKPLSQQALASLSELREQIESSGNRDLTDALGAMLARHTGKK